MAVANPLLAHNDTLPSAARHALVGSVVALHVLAAWGLMQVESVRQAIQEAAPIFVQWVAPPLPLAPTPAVPPPPTPRAVKPPPRTPIIAAKPVQQSVPESFVSPPPDPTPLPVVDMAPPPQPEAPPAPPAPPAPIPKMVPPTAVSYIEPPAVRYPPVSRRLGETGRVVLRVLIGSDGRATRVDVAQSSGFIRLDEAAQTAMRVARFRPYTENGVAQVVWTLAPIAFNLENAP